MTFSADLIWTIYSIDFYINLTDANPLSAYSQAGVIPQQQFAYVPTAGVLEDGTIQVHLTEDGRLILPPGLKLYTTDGQEVGSTGPTDEQVQDASEDTSKHLPSKTEDSSDRFQSASVNRDVEEC